MAESHSSKSQDLQATPENPLGDAFWQDVSSPIDDPPNRVRLIDNGHGGQLAYMVDGAMEGPHVINMGGNPSGLIAPNLRAMHLYLSGIACATYDRPGYGYSSRRPGRVVADSAEDVERIADDLKWDEFSIVARSGGVPHALAAASTLGRRVTRIALLAGVSEKDESNAENWTTGMTESNVERHTAAQKDPLALARDYREVARRTQESPESFLEALKDSYTELDEQVISVLGLTRMLGEGYAWALRQGGAGWFDETIALHEPWGIDWNKITAEALVWHGRHDPFAQVNHALENARRLPQVVTHISPAASHFNAMQAAVPAVAWTVHGDTERLQDRLEDIDKWCLRLRGEWACSNGIF